MWYNFKKITNIEMYKIFFLVFLLNRQSRCPLLYKSRTFQLGMDSIIGALSDNGIIWYNKQRNHHCCLLEECFGKVTPR